jgi:dipeptidyl aminopeptidase/acylaminoacyl peptidase
MKKSILITLLIAVMFTSLTAQESKKYIDHDAIEKWNRITETAISDNGKYISYKVEPWRGNSDVFIYTSLGEQVEKFESAGGIRFSMDSKYLVFKKVLTLETTRELKLKKTKKDDMPGERLGIYDIGNESLFEIENIIEYKMPEKWSAYLAYKARKTKVVDSEGETEGKKESDKNGYDLKLRNLISGDELSWPFVKTFMFVPEKEQIIFVSMGDDADFKAGIYRYDISTDQLTGLSESNGDFRQITISDEGDMGAFLLKEKAAGSKYDLFMWQGNTPAQKKVSDDSKGIPEAWVLSENKGLSFSNNMSKLFFVTAPAKPEKDTMRLDDEYPNVDIWHGTEGKTHTVQVNNKSKDMKKAYMAVYDISSGSIVQLECPGIPNVSLIDRGDNKYVLGLSNVPYELQAMWESSPLHYDVYLIDINSGEKNLIKKDIRARVQASPAGKYLIWYNYLDASYYSYNIRSGEEYRLTTPETLIAANELNDVPNYARPYNPTGWLEGDEALLVNDRYDIWSLDPDNLAKPKNLTVNGRSSNTTFAVVKFDWEERFIKNGEQLLLTGHNDITRESFYYTWNAGSAEAPKKIIGGAYSLSRPQKAAEANTVVYTRSTYNLFPDLLVSDIKFKKSTLISDANPQQKDYYWGTAELVSWTSLDGKDLDGLLYKPENFDPGKKYPMIVNFYEKSSQGLYGHRTPELHRSTIDYHYYTSNGYVVFNPDIYYEDGYPGESAFNCVMSGVSAIIEKGFVDKDRIGAQGHSWGGYQVAYLATRTDLFAAIESGAPVVNMFSAYGGIRWGSGLNRSFQYEHTQSRIGATIWESPLRYLENSPLFTMDKVTTPILIMHNDADGSVPWYQGIEYFVALRRLEKPVWMLNYTGEDHWPQKMKNKKDFQIRMSQFFNYYLKGDPMPKWMKVGIPVIEKDFDLGYELIKE